MEELKGLRTVAEPDPDMHIGIGEAIGSDRFDRQDITFLSPTVALAVGDGVSTADLQDGRSFTRRFAQSVLLVLTNGEWKVFHSHRSFPPAQ